jgi:hypothetical protein
MFKQTTTSSLSACILQTPQHKAALTRRVDNPGRETMSNQRMRRSRKRRAVVNQLLKDRRGDQRGGEWEPI